jgi:hypothetical protein
VVHPIAGAVTRVVRPPPQLLVGEGFDALAHARPVLVDHFRAREFEKELAYR